MAEVQGRDSAVANAPARRLKTLLISMPFYSGLRPSLQICGLAALGRSQGFDVDTLHLSVDLAARIGTYLNEELGTFSGYETGNWLFAAEAFPDAPPDPDCRYPFDYPEALEHLEAYGIDAQKLIALRREAVPAFLDEAMRGIDGHGYDVIGFSSTFQQNIPSFALARRLKAAFPHLVILFGGANFEGEMGEELVRANAFIDYAVDGEGEAAFVEFLEALAAGRDPANVLGVVSRKGRGTAARRPFTELSDMPLPDYGEYFERAARLGVVGPADLFQVRVPFEGSRGCWWGEKHHCTFCGLNGLSMKFRQKSGEKMLEELGEMSRRWGVFNFAGVDNILAPDYWKSFIPALAAQERNYRLFFEVKSNLSRAQVKALAEAGIVEIQPGIESLSTHVLALMKKGVKAIQNVNLLRWSRYYGVSVNWNLLFGFPGETDEDYASQTKLLPFLRHLDPPNTAGRIWMERFAPIFDDHEAFPVKYIKPLDHLTYIYPDDIDLSRVAYYFDYEFADQRPDSAYDEFIRAAHAWRDMWRAGAQPALTYRWSPGVLQITDAREPGQSQRYDFPAPLSEIYVAISERPLSAAAVADKLGLDGGAAEITEALVVMEARGLVMRDGDLFLALAIPARANG